MRPFRIMQKRGVIVDAEDFLPVTGTYPNHPLSTVVPRVSNQQQLRDERRESYKQDVANKNAAYEAHQKVVKATVSRVPDEGYVAAPKYTSIN